MVDSPFSVNVLDVDNNMNMYTFSIIYQRQNEIQRVFLQTNSILSSEITG